MASMRRNDVASTSFRRHVPTRFLINQCQIITFLMLKSDIIENSRIKLRGIIVLPVPSNQIKAAFIIILPFNLVHLCFFPVSHRHWRKMWVDYWGGGQRVCWPPLSNYWGGLAPPGPPSSYAYAYSSFCKQMGSQKGEIKWDNESWCIRSCSPASDLHYFRNKVSNFETCFQAFSGPELG